MAEVEIKAIKGGSLIDGTGGEPIEDATILIEGSKIKAVGKDIEVPKGVKVINATGKTVMPGLIDSHMHHGCMKTSTLMYEGIARPRELSLIQSINDSKDLLAAGFTTVKDCGGTNGIFLKKAVAEGTISGLPRILAAGNTLSQTYGHGDIAFLPPAFSDARTSSLIGAAGHCLICDGVPECIKAARYALRQGADFIKIMTTGSATAEKDFPSDVEFNLDEIKAIVAVAEQVGKFVTTHCQNSRGAKNSILGGVKTIDHANEMNDEVVELAKENGTIFVSTLAIFWAIVEHSPKGPSVPWAVERAKWQLEVTSETYNRIHKTGAVLAAGTDYVGIPMMPLGKNAIELELLVKHCGFTPMDAIVATTKYGAMACFMGDNIGTIEPDKSADIIIVDGNPLADITILRNVEKIKMVMLEGKIEIARGSI